MDKATGILIVLACIIGILAGATYLNNAYRVDCVDWWPFAKSRTCAVTAK